MGGTSQHQQHIGFTVAQATTAITASAATATAIAATTATVVAAATAATAATPATSTVPAHATRSALRQPQHLYSSAAAALQPLYISLTVALCPLAAARCCKLLQRLNMLHAAARRQQLLQRLQMMQLLQRLQLLQPAQLHTRCGMAAARRQLCHLVLPRFYNRWAAAVPQLCSSSAAAAHLQQLCRCVAAGTRLLCICSAAACFLQQPHRSLCSCFPAAQPQLCSSTAPTVTQRRHGYRNSGSPSSDHNCRHNISYTRHHNDCS